MPSILSNGNGFKHKQAFFWQKEEILSNRNWWKCACKHSTSQSLIYETLRSIDRNPDTNVEYTYIFVNSITLQSFTHDERALTVVGARESPTIRFTFEALVYNFLNKGFGRYVFSFFVHF